MAVLHDLIAQIEDPALRERIAKEADKLAQSKKFGLVFEEHLPECTPLYDVPVRVGSSVAQKTGYVNDIYNVLKIDGEEVLCVCRETHEEKTFKMGDIVAIAEFGEPIYPYLKPVDSVCNAPDSALWHTLIEADNYHALQLLEYLYAGKVDCIYIDPPYNTGARDWKYNNDYVDSLDTYRHSKWLSMMEKRLRIAKTLLNRENSVLIVTIDEKEYLHLGCLLEEMFPDANIQMISSVINPAGTGRKNEFSRSDEYIYFVMLGDAAPGCFETEEEKSDIIWETFRRHDRSNVRTSRPNQFYPIYVDDKQKKIVKIGEPIGYDDDMSAVPQIDGCTTVFPIRDNGMEMIWGTRPETARELLKNGYMRVRKYMPNAPQKYSIQYLKSGPIKDIQSGKAVVRGYAPDDSVIAEYEIPKDVRPKTNWNFKQHNANAFGSKILSNIFIDKRFDFPKSLYAIYDCIKLFVASKPNALIVDYFAGSGTTLHAVNLLNAEDGGQRRCIMVTNNEVSDAEAKNLSKQGYKPGNKEWEQYGIARYVTWPRTVCSIEGHDINGEPLKGNYLGSDIPIADGFKANAAYFKLGFLDKTSVALGRQFAELLPILWMKAGSIGLCPYLETKDLPQMMVLPENHFAVLIDETAFQQFVQEMEKHSDIQTVYIVTDSEDAYRVMIKEFDGKDTYQLYRDYLDNFRINTGR